MKLLLTIPLVLFLASGMLHAQNSFADFIELKENLVLEEEVGVPVQYPLYNIDNNSTIISTDFQGHQVTLYDSSGKFINQFGRHGRGPGDFEYPIATIRLDNGNLLVSEVTGKLSLFSNDGNSLIRVFDSQVFPLTNILQIDGDKILLMGTMTGENNEASLLHIYDLSSRTIEKSFLKLPFSHSDYAQVFRMQAQLAVASLYEDKIMGVVTPFNKVYLFSRDGTQENSFKMELKNFVEVTKPNRVFSNEEIFEFTTTFSIVDRIFFLHNGTFLVQYSRVTEVDAQRPDLRTMEYNLAHLDASGELIFDLNDTPELVAVDRRTSSLFFRGAEQDPSYLMRGNLKEH